MATKRDERAEAAALKIYGDKQSSIAQRALFQVLSWGVVAGVFRFYFLGGAGAIAGSLGTTFAEASLLRRGLLFACAAIYASRPVITQTVFLKRRFGWNEFSTVIIWVAIIQGVMAYLGGTNSAPVDGVAMLGAALYLLGSYFNTGSEWMRMVWKARPENKGRLYTEGLFKYSMHINYFGDFILFSGFAMITGRFYAFVIPLLMASFFIFVNIPLLDRYLASHYKDEFPAYAQKTAKFFPFVY